MHSRAFAGLVAASVLAVPLSAMAADDQLVAMLRQTIDTQQRLISTLTQQIAELRAALARYTATSSSQLAPSYATLVVPPTTLPSSADLVASLLASSTPKNKVSDLLLGTLSGTARSVANAFDILAGATSSTATKVTAANHAPSTPPNECRFGDSRYPTGATMYGNACPGAACAGVTGPLLTCAAGEWRSWGASVCKAYPSTVPTGTETQNDGLQTYLRFLGCEI